METSDVRLGSYMVVFPLHFSTSFIISSLRQVDCEARLFRSIKPEELVPPFFSISGIKVLEMEQYFQNVEGSIPSRRTFRISCWARVHIESMAHRARQNAGIDFVSSCLFIPCFSSWWNTQESNKHFRSATELVPLVSNLAWIKFRQIGNIERLEFAQKNKEQ